MQKEYIKLFKCPISKTDLQIEIFKEAERDYGGVKVPIIKEGVLISEIGLLFPIIDGIPRMLMESIYDYKDFLQQHLTNYNTYLNKLEKDFSGLMKFCIKKNKKTKESFAFEWSFLDTKKEDKLWHTDLTDLEVLLLSEFGESESFFNGKKIIDVGCGHGLLTTKLANMSQLAVGVEISKAVETAYTRNQSANAVYIQADLQFLPFADSEFDILYSSGVLIVTNNTELSLSMVSGLVKKGGKLSVWLYHPQKYFMHNAQLFLRKFTRRLPLKVCFWFIMIFIFPISFLVKKIKGRKVNAREEIIDLLDGFSPEYREEVEQDVARSWLMRRSYTDIAVTTENQFGFSIVGTKGN